MPVLLVHQVFLVHAVHLVPKVIWDLLALRVTKVFPVHLASKVTKAPRVNKVKWE